MANDRSDQILMKLIQNHMAHKSSQQEFQDLLGQYLHTMGTDGNSAKDSVGDAVAQLPADTLVPLRDASQQAIPGLDTTNEPTLQGGVSDLQHALGVTGK